MAQLSVKPGDSIVVDGFDKDIVLEFDRIDNRRAELTVSSPGDVSIKHRSGPKPDTNVQSNLKDIAEDVISLLSQVDAAASQELLSQFVSDLFYAQAQKRQKEERHVKQCEGIAAAKARGVQFGATRKPLPENFEKCHEAWRNGQMSLRQAAKACGMAHTTFRNAAERVERAG